MPQPNVTRETERSAPGEGPTTRIEAVAGAGGGGWAWPDPASVGAWLIPFGLIVYLGVENGGFEQPVFSEVGIAAWWLVALGVLAGALSTVRIGRAAWVAIALLAAFAGWTAIGVSWSESSGRSVVEVARVVVYVGVLAAALLIGGRARARATLGAVGTGCAVIALIALLSRLHPGWFPANELPQVLVGVQSRLAYPIGYWNALAGLIAIGLPLILWAAVSARSLPLRGLAAAAVPPICLASYFTYSRGGLVATAVALIALVALSERRLSLIAPFTVLVAARALVIWEASRRHDLADGLATSAAHAQGDAMIVIVAGVGLIAGVVVGAMALLESRGSVPMAPYVPRRWALGLTAAVVVIGAAAFVGLDGPGRVADGFDQFKEPVGLSDTSTRLASVAGNGRWQYWSAAADANSTAPLIGIGPGTFVFYWSQHRDISNGFVRDAHSLFVETLGELGIVGLVLIAGFVSFVLGVGVRRTSRAWDERRGELAAATAAALAFAVAAGVDWLWELAVIPVAFLFIAAAILRDDADADDPSPRDDRASGPGRLALVGRVATALAALGAFAVIAVPMLSEEHVTESQADFRAGDLGGALDAAESAADLQPYAGAPRVQEAFVLERMGALSKAAAAARAATERESTNWETWYALSRIQAQRKGKEGSAIRALRRAQELDPFNPTLNPAALSG